MSKRFENIARCQHIDIEKISDDEIRAGNWFTGYTMVEGKEIRFDVLVCDECAKNPPWTPKIISASIGGSR